MGSRDPDKPSHSRCNFGLNAEIFSLRFFGMMGVDGCRFFGMMGLDGFNFGFRI